jgi:hypothetical protein
MTFVKDKMYSHRVTNNFNFKWSVFRNSIILASLTGDQMRIKHWWNDTDKGNLKYWETSMTYPIAILCTTNCTWSGLVLNLGLWGEIFILKSWFLDRQNCDSDTGMNFIYYFQFSAAYDTCPEQLNQVTEIHKPDRVV